MSKCTESSKASNLYWENTGNVNRCNSAQDWQDKGVAIASTAAPREAQHCFSIGSAEMCFLITSFFQQGNTNWTFCHCQQPPDPISTVNSEWKRALNTRLLKLALIAQLEHQQHSDSKPSTAALQHSTHQPDQHHEFPSPLPDPKSPLRGPGCHSESEAMQQHPRGQCQDPSMGWAASHSTKIKDLGWEGKRNPPGWLKEVLGYPGKEQAQSEGVNVQHYYLFCGNN